jgi:hypothetical protein
MYPLGRRRSRVQVFHWRISAAIGLKSGQSNQKRNKRVSYKHQRAEVLKSETYARRRFHHA